MLSRQSSSSGVVWYQSPLLSSIGVPHAFSTRLGGVSPPPFDSLNMGNPSGVSTQDSYDRIWENYRLLQAAIGAGGREILRVHQVHGGKVMIDDADSCRRTWNKDAYADAIVVAGSTRMASVRTADCVPVLLAAADGSAVAAVHAGWRGVIAGVLPAAVASMRAFSPGVPILAAIGPSIGFEAFEVGPEVLAAFGASFGNAAPVRRRADGKGHVDLRKGLAMQLEKAGVRREAIDSTDRCTVRDEGEFYSHRRDNGVTGRMTALVGVA
jgi:YfiH family protein